MDRAVVFVDGNNWYHGCVAIGIRYPGRLDFVRLSRKLVQHRTWTATRYYVGEAPMLDDLELAAKQQRFLAALRSRDPRITVHLGRLEPRESRNEAATRLLHYLAGLKVRIEPSVYRDLLTLAKKSRRRPSHGREGRRCVDRRGHGRHGRA